MTRAHVDGIHMPTKGIRSVTGRIESRAVRASTLRKLRAVLLTAGLESRSSGVRACALRGQHVAGFGAFHRGC